MTHISKSLLFLTIIAMILCSCQEGEVAAGESPNKEISALDSLIVVNQGGFKFSMTLPKELLAGNAAEIAFNETTGLLEVACGEGFMFHISRGAMDMNLLKKELKEELMFRNEIKSEENNSILYQRTLPDGNAFFHHYVCNLQIGNESCHARTASEGEFSLQQVERIKKAISSISNL